MLKFRFVSLWISPIHQSLKKSKKINLYKNYSQKKSLMPNFFIKQVIINFQFLNFMNFVMVLLILWSWYKLNSVKLLEAILQLHGNQRKIHFIQILKGILLYFPFLSSKKCLLSMKCQRRLILSILDLLSEVELIFLSAIMQINKKQVMLNFHTPMQTIDTKKHHNIQLPFSQDKNSESIFT
jgi:hypothetical protein